MDLAGHRHNISASDNLSSEEDHRVKVNQTAAPAARTSHQPRPQADTKALADPPAAAPAPAPAGPAPGRASPVSHALTPSSIGGSHSNSATLLDTAGSAQIRDAAFAAQSATPDDDLIPILEGEPAATPAPPPPPTPPTQQQETSRTGAAAATLVDPPSATADESFPEPLSYTADAGATTQRPTAAAGTAEVYGVYDPSGAVEYESAPPLLGGALDPEEEDEGEGEGFAVVSTTVTASYIVGAAGAAGVDPGIAEEIAAVEGALLLPAVAATAAALAATGDQNPADVAAGALLLLSSLTAAAEEAAVAAAAEDLLAAAAEPGKSAPRDLLEPGPSSQSDPTRFSLSQPPASPYTADQGTDTETDMATNMATKAYPPPASAAVTAGLGAGGSHPEWHDYASLPQRYKTSVEAMRSLAAARLMEQHWDAAEHLDVEVTWDAPPIWIQGREPMRVAVWLAKWAAAVHLDPLMVKMDELDSKRTALELLLQARVMPHRPWWLPATWLLPREVNLMGTVKLRISKGPREDGSTDVVTLIDGKLHNAPKLFTPLRMLNGLLMGYLPAATEALWSPVVGMLGDPSYRKRAEEHPSIVYKATTAASAAATAAAERTHAAVVSSVGGAKEAVTSAADSAAAAADRAADATAGGGTGGVIDSAKRVAHGAAEAVRGVVHEAAGAVKGGVAVGAEKVTEAAGRAKKAVTGSG